ncbi:uncharacterized protein EI90DRAFT_826843 [Cantharellus anzutake]|uniref:uncharacterized protein n=1 Tax=Cantharellus anzutake TaxID=1750568 RepID=UPI001905AB50|nr:uncharacterized protein EI90DRAFT_826843 [Cantharellus anzutake]KAF8343074.1 hypothetical protein EI90DRAFT_826843 [Cantharellus anzutake]
MPYMASPNSWQIYSALLLIVLLAPLCHCICTSAPFTGLESRQDPSLYGLPYERAHLTAPGKAHMHQKANVHLSPSRGTRKSKHRNEAEEPSEHVCCISISPSLSKRGMRSCARWRMHLCVSRQKTFISYHL